MRNITIIGMGLIGTSLGLALRNADPATSPLGALQITGYDHDPRVARAARERLAIDQVAPGLAAAVDGAQLVVLATPVRAMQTLLRELAGLLAPHTIVTDTASTKADVCTWARDLLPATVDFVGGHPMAGREQAGPAAADGTLFHDAIYCLTPDPATREQALNLVEALVLTSGARPYYIDPAEHDAYVAGISHLPFLLSAALVSITSQSPAWQELSSLAASGFRDVSRLASGDPAMHRDICLTNRAALTRWVDEAIGALADMRTALEQADEAHFDALFTQTKAARDAWLQRAPHLRPGEEHYTDRPEVERRPLLGFPLPTRRKDKP
jgi:prephenate dehydrogenase